MFKHSPVFRIGGDEFVVVLRGEDLSNLHLLLEQFQHNLDEMESREDLPEWERVTAAIGVAYYNPDYDSNVEMVFRRADKEMYKKKKEMHALREG